MKRTLMTFSLFFFKKCFLIIVFTLLHNVLRLYFIIYNHFVQSLLLNLIYATPLHTALIMLIRCMYDEALKLGE